METDRYIHEHDAAFETIKDAKRVENRERHTAFSADMIETIAANEARREIQKEAALLTFEEFLERRKQRPDFSSIPIGSVAATELETEPEIETGSATVEPRNIASDPAPTTQTEAAIEPTMDATSETAATEARPAMPEPMMIELISNPPPNELGGSAAGQGSV